MLFSHQKFSLKLKFMIEFLFKGDINIKKMHKVVRILILIENEGFFKLNSADYLQSILKWQYT